ncbi:14279_t:CDS:1, partial [Gigaspora margarita]
EAIEDEVDRKKRSGKKIEEAINTKCIRIVDKQRKMLTILLKKPFKKVQIDRLLIKQNNKQKLVNKCKRSIEENMCAFSETIQMETT